MTGRHIYLHGFASGPGSQKARAFREAFQARGAALEVPDLSEGDFDNLTISGQLAVVDRLAAGRPVSLIGSSMGGYLAALYAARHPEVEKLVLLAPAFGFARRWAEGLGPGPVAAWRDSGFLEVYHYGEKRNRKLRYRVLEDAALHKDFPGFSQPALIFHGRRDDVVPAALSEQFAAAHPNARLELLDSGHELLDVLDGILAESSRFLLG